MNDNFLHYPVGPVAMKIAVAIGIGMLIGMERKWSHKEAGIRAFSIVSLLGALSAVISPEN
nr:MgtC/SapB family protein [Mucilaginibacter sp. L294]